MKHLLSILLISSICLTQEMEVQGDLKVTGQISAESINSKAPSAILSTLSTSAAKSL